MVCMVQIITKVINKCLILLTKLTDYILLSTLQPLKWVQLLVISYRSKSAPVHTWIATTPPDHTCPQPHPVFSLPRPAWILSPAHRIPTTTTSLSPPPAPLPSSLYMHLSSLPLLHILKLIPAGVLPSITQNALVEKRSSVNVRFKRCGNYCVHCCEGSMHRKLVSQ